MKMRSPPDGQQNRAANGRAASGGKRAERLKAALKANIARRKQQARARSETGAGAADDNEADTGADRSERG